MSEKREAAQLIEALHEGGSYSRHLAGNAGRALCRALDARFHEDESEAVADIAGRINSRVAA